MNISVNVQLMEGDALEKTPTEIAGAVLQVLDGDESKDICQVTVSQPAPPPGVVGTPPAPPPLEE